MQFRPLTVSVPKSNWVSPEQHRNVAGLLMRYGLYRADNTRQLPLTGGGKTDLYVNIRPGRSDPQANIALASLYALPIRWLGVSRILEVPDAISGVAAFVSAFTGIPYATIRKDEKPGRDPVIGEVHEGEDVVIIDDVITDGASKIPALELCKQRKLNVRAIIVLVDRQQGWEETLSAAGFFTPVWAGMTLHDFRREVIASGKMDRCDREVERRNPIIVALDGKSLAESLSIADRLRTTGCILKVNDLIKREGADHLLPELQTYGRVFVDYKDHDIPNTVFNDCCGLRPHRPWAVSVHASGGGDMIKAAQEGLRVFGTKILGITVLTSLDRKHCRAIYGRSPRDQVKKLAEIIVDARADGIVCSGEEVGMLRKFCPGYIELVVPGIRSPGTDANEQKRVDTPINAIINGANYVVMGRQILNAHDPVDEMSRVISSELHIQ